MRSILERAGVWPADVEALMPAIVALARGRIDAATMAHAMTNWLHGRSYDLGTAESLPDKVARSLAMDGPASAKDLAKRVTSELDSVYHALFRLQKRQTVRCDRSRRPYVWKLSNAQEEASPEQT